MNDEAKAYINKPIRVMAIQWTGDNLRLIQDFVWPASPYFQPRVLAENELVDKPEIMRVPTVDHLADVAYPALAPNIKEAEVPRGAWLVLYHDGLQVLTAQQFARMFQIDQSQRHHAEAGREVTLSLVREPHALDDGTTIDRGEPA